MTVLVVTDKDDIIIDAAPIVRKFKGQHIKNLADWMRNKPPFKWHEIGL